MKSSKKQFHKLEFEVAPEDAESITAWMKEYGGDPDLWPVAVKQLFSGFIRIHNENNPIASNPVGGAKLPNAWPEEFTGIIKRCVVDKVTADKGGQTFMGTNFDYAKFYHLMENFFARVGIETAPAKHIPVKDSPQA